jgi:protocatechuate 3,4-dioxygenase beta subunit
MQTGIVNLYRAALVFFSPAALSILFVMTSCAQEKTSLDELESAVKSGKLDVSGILSSEKYIQLHADRGFRNLIKENAPVGKILVVTDKEPGSRIVVQGRLLGPDKQPLENTLFFFYHTMNDGIYTRDKNQRQQEVSQLFGYMRTDDHGAFEIHTIKPGGYPGEKFPSHVHVQVYNSDETILYETEFQFSDDPRLTSEMRASSMRHGNLVAENSGTKERPVYRYEVVLPK